MGATPLSKYLARHAEPEAALAGALPAFEHVVAVPACGEPAGFMRDLAPALHDGALTIVVVNGAAEDAATARVNAETLAVLRAGATSIATSPPAYLRGDPPLLVIDRASAGHEVPAKQAVGLARKIAGDVACALFAARKLRSRLIHMTDCDVRLPRDYLSATGEGAVLLTYPFHHVAGDEAAIDEAHAIYEVFLRYYVLGLAWARSPYALHTIGSTLAVDVNAYAAVRGVPRRQAAEDFYLVNKVRKLGAASTPDTTPLSIVSRRSLRVPFGTGRSTAKIADAGSRDLYHPQIFTLVKSWLEAVEEHAEEGSSATEVAVARTPREHRDALVRALDALDAEAALERALTATPSDAAARRRRAHEHFDAFRTRKLVHLLRDEGLGELPWREALARADFLDVDASADPFSLCRALAAAEREVTA